jgi:peptidoglycan hydrolase-like protein with peptidoglycan-binding domain
MMTPLEWFAFVILPATLAVVAFGASRLFDRLHPVPVDVTEFPPVRSEAAGSYPSGFSEERTGAYQGIAVLRRGDSGGLVGQLQRKLGVVSDGVFGPDTEVAVRQFQRARGLVADGVVGPQTWAALGHV